MEAVFSRPSRGCTGVLSNVFVIWAPMSSGPHDEAQNLPAAPLLFIDFVRSAYAVDYLKSRVDEVDFA